MKGMRNHLLIGMSTIFISVIFILLTSEVMLSGHFQCPRGWLSCTAVTMDAEFGLGMLFIFLFMLVDLLTMYIILKNLYFRQSPES